MSIQLSLLGGSEIGASSILLEICNYKILIDCGVRFDSQAPLPNLDLLSGKHLDAILVTHAHSDHTGALPVVHSSFPEVPILMTPPTIELVKVLQRDSLKLMDMTFKKEGELPLYKQQQVESMLSQVIPIHYMNRWTLGELVVHFLPASHIIGSSMIHIATPKGRILFTGDYCITAQKTVPALDRPPFPVDILISEATYGARLHSDRKVAETTLIANIREITMNGGRVLIPCFAIGRAQEVLLIIRQAIEQKKLPQIPIFVDGMVRHVCNIYKNNDRYVSRTVLHASKKGHPFYNSQISPVKDAKDRQKVLQTSPCVVVASSGMLVGGPSAFYASHFAANANDAIFITGYQDEESPGAALLKTASTKENKTILLNDTKVDVKCCFDTYNLSAHADRMQICGFVSAFRPKTVVLVHGDQQAKQNLKPLLECRDVEIGWDGLVIDRTYRKIQLNPAPSLPVITTEHIKSLIGNEPGPFKIEVLAEASSGRNMNKEEIALFTDQVEATGLLKRDDYRRSIFKRVTKNKPDNSNNANEEIIKQENPKGKLNELCLKNKFSHPQKRLAKNEDGQYHCILTLKLANKTFTTKQHIASSKIIAEQYASQELLAAVNAHIHSLVGQPQEKPVVELNAKKINPNARSTINHYLQMCFIKSFECLVLKTEGAAHAPVFTMQASTTLANESLIQGEIVNGNNKKKTQSLATTLLLEVLEISPQFIQIQKDLRPSNTPPKTKTANKPDDKALQELINLLKVYDQKYNSKLPFKYLKRLAKEIYKCNKLSDKDWILEQLCKLHQQWERDKTKQAQEENYYPFIQFRLDIYNFIVENYQLWPLEYMKEYLDDPTCIFPNWGIQFAAAMSKIGKDKCDQHTENLYQFVTTHSAWEESNEAREKLNEAIAIAKLNKTTLNDGTP